LNKVERRVYLMKRANMTCVMPPEPDDFQLLAFLDGGDQPGNAQAELAAHLRICPHCFARAAGLYRMEAYLGAAFYRRSCPSAGELGEYRLGLLDRKAASAITRHLAECPHCARELAQLSSFLGDLAPQPEPSALERAIEGVKVTVARLVSGGKALVSAPGPVLGPAYAGVRGGGAEIAIYEADSVQVMVSAASLAGRPGHVELLGLVTGLDPAGVTVHLWRERALVATVPLDEGANFSVSDLASGSYELVLAGRDREIYVEDLQV
jgi:anti-sigma factor RsiW